VRHVAQTARVGRERGSSGGRGRRSGGVRDVRVAIQAPALGLVAVHAVATVLQNHVHRRGGSLRSVELLGKGILVVFVQMGVGVRVVAGGVGRSGRCTAAVGVIGIAGVVADCASNAGAAADAVPPLDRMVVFARFPVLAFSISHEVQAVGLERPLGKMVVCCCRGR